MKSYFVDTNVLLRFLIGDDPAQERRSAAVLKQAEAGKISLVMGPPVLFEMSWVLRQVQKESLEETLDAMEAMMSHPGMHVLDEEIARSAIGLSRERNMEFADAYIASSARMRHLDGIATFNHKDFKNSGLDLFEI